MTKVVYFNGMGRAEFIRMMLWHAGVDFEDERIEQEDWPGIKMSGRFPLGSMPLVTLDGVIMAQSKASARAVAIKHGYYVTDPMLIHNVDSLLDFSQENFDAIAGYMFDPDKNDEKNKKWLDSWTKRNNLFENRLKGHGKAFIGATDKPTLADFSCISPYLEIAFNEHSVWKGPLQDAVVAGLESCPCLKRWIETMKQ